MPSLPNVRIVGFVDLLGFSDLLVRIGVGEDGLLERLLRSLDLAEAAAAEAGDTLRLTAFSDSIVISSEPEDLARLVDALGVLTRRLLLYGVACRGGISQGWTFHEGSRVFGAGLLGAYRTESRLAVYPRLLISGIPNMWRLNREVPTGGDTPSPIRRITEDFDGGVYIDLLNGHFSSLGPEFSELEPYLDLSDPFFAAGFFGGQLDFSSLHEVYLAVVRTVICKEMLRVARDASHLSKWQWLRQRFNEQLLRISVWRQDRQRLIPIEWPPRPHSTGFGWPEEIHYTFDPDVGPTNAR